MHILSIVISELVPKVAPRQNALKSDLKKSRICPIWGQSDPRWTQYEIPNGTWKRALAVQEVQEWRHLTLAADWIIPHIHMELVHFRPATEDVSRQRGHVVVAEVKGDGVLVT